MNFSNIVGNISDYNLLTAKKKFTQLIIELSVRKGNYFVGSGLGGNNFQLLVLMSIPQILTARGVKIEVTNEGIIWGSKYLRKSKMRDIRFELDRVFPQIKEKFKYNALAIETLVKSNSFHEKFEEHKEHFPNVDKAYNKGKCIGIESLNDMEKLILSYILCSHLSSELDKGIETNIGSVGKVLYKMPSEIIVMSVRQFIQLNRLVKHNIDEHPEFGPVLNRINREADEMD